MKNFTLIILLTMVTICPLKAVDFPEIKDWQPTGEISTYTPDNLYEYINGAADAYLAYGFQILQTRDLSSKGTTVAIDIYDMGTRLNAFGIYKSERPIEPQKLPIGVEAVISPPYQCLLLKDTYYVKVNVFEGEINESNGIALLEAIAKALPGEVDFPEALQQLPAVGKIPDSENFVRQDFLGLTELTNCVYAKYKDEDKEFQCFVMLPLGDETKESIWEKLAQEWEKLEHRKYPVLFKKIPYKGLNGVMLTDKKILGVTDCADEAELVKRLEAVAE